MWVLRKIRRMALKLCIEVPLFLLFFSFMLTAPVLSNLIIYRTCYVTLGFNKTECALMGTKEATSATAELEKKVQPYANVFGTTKSVLDAITSCIVCIFLGSWSDKYGRRPILLFNLSGFTLGYVCSTLFAFFEYLSPWYLLGTVILNVTGGIAAFMSVALCYITDTTTENNRGTRMGLIDAALSGGMILGTFLSSFVFEYFGYVVLFVITTLSVGFALLYTYLFIPESVQVQQSENKFKDIISASHLKDTFRVAFKLREHKKRAILLLTIAMMTLCVFVSSDAGTLFLYLRSRFLWPLEQFTIYSAIVGVYGIICTIFVVYVLHKMLNIPETILILVGLISILNSSLMIGLSSNSTHIYAAAVVKGLSSGVNPMARTLLSKTVPPEEMGKLFAVFAPLEVLSAIIILPLYTLVYNATIDVFPSAYNFMSAGYTAVAIVILMFIIHIQKRQNDATYTPVSESTA